MSGLQSASAELTALRGLELQRALSLAVDTADIVDLLRFSADLSSELIALGTGRTSRAVRNWSKGSVARRAADDRLRALADVVAELAQALTPRGIGQWLAAPCRYLQYERPVNAIADGRGMDVLQVARCLVGGDYE